MNGHSVNSCNSLNSSNSLLICSDTDFNTALELVKILIQHAARIYEALPTETEKPTQPNPKQQILEALPPEFSRQDYLTISKNLNIPDKTAQRHIEKYLQTNLIERISHGNYRKK
jgi:hypothetical protein